jgi:DNA polymerase III subunit epsilon
MYERQLVLDTETTGLDPMQGHRVIEIGCIELINRRQTDRRFHVYLKPDRDIDSEATRIHGITSEFLKTQPRFTDIADEFFTFIQGAKLIIHNAPFDLGFLNYEFQLCGRSHIILEKLCTVEDTLLLARRRHPGQRNSLDALCKRYNIDSSQRTLHGALLDAEILADVYLAMTRQQSKMFEREQVVSTHGHKATMPRVTRDYPPLLVIRASDEEALEHDRYLDMLDDSNGGKCVWKQVMDVINKH